MGLPPEHTTLLRQQDYTVHPTGVLDERERLLLVRYGRWMEALSAGTIAPVTPEQERFVRVARGEIGSSSEFEQAWVKLRQAQAAADSECGSAVDPMEVADCLRQLAAAHEAAELIQGEYGTRRSAILEQVRAQLETLDAEYSERLRAASEVVSRRQAEVKEAVLQLGESVRQYGIHAVYSRGRVSWDSRGLYRYLENHPELAVFRRFGVPFVSIRYRPAES